MAREILSFEILPRRQYCVGDGRSCLFDRENRGRRRKRSIAFVKILVKE